MVVDLWSGDAFYNGRVHRVAGYINAGHCKKSLVPVFHLYPVGNLMFMQDNAQVHTVRIKTSFLKAEGVEVLSRVWTVHRPQPHGIFVEIFKSKDSRQEILQC